MPPLLTGTVQSIAESALHSFELRCCRSRGSSVVGPRCGAAAALQRAYARPWQGRGGTAGNVEYVQYIIVYSASTVQKVHGHGHVHRKAINN
jgi:hypothetical protein